MIFLLDVPLIASRQCTAPRGQQADCKGPDPEQLKGAKDMPGCQTFNPRLALEAVAIMIFANTILQLLLSSLLSVVAATAGDPHPWEASLRAYTMVNGEASACYDVIAANRQHDVALTVLLPGPSSGRSRMQEANLRNLLDNTPADVVFFHTGWAAEELAELRQQFTVPVTATCIAREDWTFQQDLESWEYVMTEFQGPGYRSMCRWYSRQVCAHLQ